MRLLALAAAALALLAWLRRERPDPYWGLAEQQLEEDGVQPPDPVTLPGYPLDWSKVRVWPANGTGDFWPQPWVNTSRSYGTGGNADAILEPLTAADRSYLEATTLAIRRSTQSTEVTTEGMS